MITTVSKTPSHSLVLCALICLSSLCNTGNDSFTPRRQQCLRKLDMGRTLQGEELLTLIQNFYREIVEVAGTTIKGDVCHTSPGTRNMKRRMKSMNQTYVCNICPETPASGYCDAIAATARGKVGSLGSRNETCKLNRNFLRHPYDEYSAPAAQSMTL